MGRLYINPTLEKSIRDYCEANSIEDINAFANRCASQGFSIVKYGVSPIDNINRQNNGIKDIEKNENRKKKDVVGNNEEKQDDVKQDNNSTEKNKKEVTIRRIRVIKKD